MSKFSLKWTSLALLLICCQFSGAQAEDKKADAKKANKITFDEHIQPIMRAKCLSCHNPNKKSSGLDLSSYTSLMVGGSSGEVIEPGSADDSYLYLLVTHESEPFMPPKSDKMPTETLNTIRDWINAGAPENAGSKPLVSKKPKFDLAIASPGRGIDAYRKITFLYWIPPRGTPPANSSKLPQDKQHLHFALKSDSP